LTLATNAWSQVAITSPANNATVSGTNVTISVTLGSGVSWENIYIDGAYFHSTPPTSFAWDSTSVVNGNHTISANGYSSTGSLVGTASVTVNVQNASQAPAVTITAPANNATVSGAVNITAQVNKSTAWINFYIDGSYLASSPPFSTTWDTTQTNNGTHSVSANAYNSSGTL